MAQFQLLVALRIVQPSALLLLPSPRPCCNKIKSTLTPSLQHAFTSRLITRHTNALYNHRASVWLPLPTYHDSYWLTKVPVYHLLAFYAPTTCSRSSGCCRMPCASSTHDVRSRACRFAYDADIDSNLYERSVDFNWGRDKVRGVNIGGWLVLEP
jgi:hypothetical protein